LASLQDGNIGVGIFPEREEIVVTRANCAEICLRVLFAERNSGYRVESARFSDLGQLFAARSSERFKRQRTNRWHPWRTIPGKNANKGQRKSGNPLEYPAGKSIANCWQVDRELIADSGISDYRKLPDSGLRNIAGKSGADYLRIVGGFSLRRGNKGLVDGACSQISVAGVAETLSGQFRKRQGLI